MLKWAMVPVLVFAPGVLAQEAAPAAKPAVAVQDQSAGESRESYRIVNQQDEIVAVLENGITVIAKRVHSPVMTVRGYVKTGGIYEGKWLGGGLSHLLEHLVAGGSTERRTEGENRSLLQELGNNSNAYTTTGHTAYFINTTPEHMERAVDLLTGWLLGAKITPEEYKREYQVVQRELEKGKGEPGRQFYYLSNLNRYRVSPARVPVIGYQEVIQGLSRDDVYDYYKLAYVPNNMLFVIAGDADPADMVAAIQKYTAGAVPGRAFSHDIADEPPVVAPRSVVATFPRLGQAQLELAFPTIRLDHPDLYALDLLATVLGEGESSLLVEELRDKQQLVTGINSYNGTPDYVAGSFEIGMRLNPENIEPATAALLKIIEQVKQEELPADRIDRAKTLVRVARVRNQQTAEEIAATMARDYLGTGDAHFSDHYTERMQSVTAADLKRVANEWLKTEHLLTTALLPAEYVGAKGLAGAEAVLRGAIPNTPEQSDVTAANEVTRVELANGVILLLKRIPTSPMVNVAAYSLGGLSVESAENNGIGNLAMQMLPRGTTTRSAQEISEFFDSIGGDISTGMGNNSFFWNASFLKEDTEKALSVYADVMLHPGFDEKELAAMKSRVLAAIASQDADWQQLAIRFYRETFYGKANLPYQFMQIGKAENIEQLTADDLRKWYTEQALGSRRVIAIYGDIDIDQTKAMAEKLLGQGQAIERNIERQMPDVGKKSETAGPAKVVVDRVEVKQSEHPVAGVVIGFNSNSIIGDESNYPILVADTMSSGYGYPTGYLHEVLRGRGLVYMVHAMNSPGLSEKLPGSFIVIAGCDPAAVNEVVEASLENIARLQGDDTALVPGWFDRAKELMLVSDAMDNETGAEQATMAALDELYGMGYNYHDQFAPAVRKVTADDIRAIARQRLRHATVTITTPKPDVVKVETGERTYDSFPDIDLTPKGVTHDAN